LISLALAVASLARDFVLVTGYVNQSFPQPLTKQQESEYFERWQKGDRKAYQTLIEHNLRLVAHVAKKFDSSGIDHDDLISIGTVGLIKAVETFQPTKGTKFATYAARCIQNEILKSETLRNIFPRHLSTFTHETHHASCPSLRWFSTSRGDDSMNGVKCGEEVQS
jgi:hypothetical protein